jgi:hypothetical protein
MMSYKTLHNIPSKWQNVFLPKEEISNVFQSDEAYNCLHYADYDDNPELSRCLAEAISYGGKKIHALQLDMIWPDPEEIDRAVQLSGKKIEVILQIGKNAIEKMNNDPNAVIEKLREYKGKIHRVLLDKSMGRGLGMDALGLLPFVTAIRESFPEVGIAVAGGLGPETIHLVQPLTQIFPSLSIDAQGKLRPSGNALDPIDWNMATKYLIEALKLFA